MDGAAERNLAFLRDLLRIPKPRMREHGAVRFAADALRRAGCEVDVFEGEGIGEPTPDGPPLNVLARRPGRGGEGGSGRSILLEAHLDTVPPGSRDRWSRDPWAAEIVDGEIYARGAHDDVAGVALVCLAAVSLAELNVKTAADVHFLVTTEEEYSSGGMRALLKHRPDLRPDAHLLVDGNATPDQCIIGHPGSLSFTIHIPGPFGSAQDPLHVHDANPIELASQVMGRLRETEKELGARSEQRDPGWPAPTIAFIGVRSSGWVSNVPESSDLDVWGNVIPPMTLEAYRQVIESAVRECAQRAPWFAEHPPHISWGPIDCPALVTPTDSPFYQSLAAAHARSFGSTLKPRYIGGWGDMRLLGCTNALFYGPGGGGGDHGYDEHYHLADFNPMLRSLLFLVNDWCG